MRFLEEAILKMSLSAPSLRRPSWSTARVANWFRQHSDGIGSDGESLPESWAPATTSDGGPYVALGGDIDAPELITSDHRWNEGSYRWYDLRKVPVGGRVVRYTTERNLRVFVRVGEDAWDIRALWDVKPPKRERRPPRRRASAESATARMERE